MLIPDRGGALGSRGLWLSQNVGVLPVFVYT